MIKYYVTDVETTGLDSKMQEITEISIIRADDKAQLTKMIKCEYPERASLDALKITRKTMQDLISGEPKESVIDRIDKFFLEDNSQPSHRCFIGHNVGFDRKFIHALYDKVNKKCPVDLWLDTMSLTKTFVKTAGMKSKVNLQAACDLVGIKKIATSHTSKHDARNTYLLWKELVDNRKIDFLPHIKNIPHFVPISNDDLEDLSDIE